MLGLDLVVELVGDPLADLGQHRARVEPRREALEDRADEPEAAQVGLDGLGRARMLHLDRHVLAVARARAVDLAERGERRTAPRRSRRTARPTRASRSCSITRSHAAEGDRRRAVGQRTERRSALAAAPIELDHREELRDLRPGALQPPELRPELLGQRQGARVLAATRSPSLAVERRPARPRGPAQRTERLAAAAQQLAPAAGIDLRGLGRLA